MAKFGNANEYHRLNETRTPCSFAATFAKMLSVDFAGDSEPVEPDRESKDVPKLENPKAETGWRGNSQHELPRGACFDGRRGSAMSKRIGFVQAAARE
jgi:hypothetical protein